MNGSDLGANKITALGALLNLLRIVIRHTHIRNLEFYCGENCKKNECQTFLTLLYDVLGQDTHSKKRIQKEKSQQKHRFNSIIQ